MESEKSVIRSEQQIYQGACYGNIEPDRENPPCHLLMLVELVGNRVSKSQKDKGETHRCQHNMCQQNEKVKKAKTPGNFLLRFTKDAVTITIPVYGSGCGEVVRYIRK